MGTGESMKDEVVPAITQKRKGARNTRQRERERDGNEIKGKAYRTCFPDIQGNIH
jgi:hypothetical protein